MASTGQPLRGRTEAFISDAFADSWRLFKANPVLFLLTGLVVLLLGAFTLGVMAGPLLWGFIDIIRRRNRGEPVTVSEVFRGTAHLLPTLLLTVIIAVGVVLGSMLLVLPGLAVAWVTMFAYHEATYRGLGVVESLRGSYAIIKAQPWLTLLFFLILALLNSLGSAIVLLVLATFPFSMVVLTLSYERLGGASSGPPAPTTPLP